MIKGKTLESRDLKQLLARAVAQKRNSDRTFMRQNLSRGQVSNGNPSGVGMAARGAAAIQ